MANKMESPQAGVNPPYAAGAPRYSNRLLPHVIEEDVAKDPTRIVGILANSTPPMIFTQITISQLSQAIGLEA
jgi:hypothetical protein